MNETEEILRGQDAEQLLGNKIYKEVMGKVRSGIIESMAASALGDESTHHRLVIALQIFNQIEKQITEIAETGKMASIQVQERRFFGLKVA